MAPRRQIKSTTDTDVSVVKNSTTPPVELSTLPTNCFKQLIAHAFERLDRGSTFGHGPMPQNLVGYFMLVAMDHADGIYPTTTRLRAKTGSTHKGIMTPIKFLMDAGLVETGSFKNANAVYERYFFVSAGAIKAATKRSR